MLFIAVTSPIILAILLIAFGKSLGNKIGMFVLALPFLLFLYFLSQVDNTLAGNILGYYYAWVPDIGINLSFSLDGLSLLFCLLITGIGTVVVWYSHFYLSRKEKLVNFYVYILLFMSAMLGVTTARNLVIIYLFWELTSISSFLLIGFWFHKERSRYGAQKSLLLTVAGGFCMLVAFVMMWTVGHSFEIGDLMNQASLIKASPLYPAIIILFLLGAFTKSAQIPFHIWLPAAMEAPTPISCYLHSATMVKAGIYIIARFLPLLGGTLLWFTIISLIGIGSLFWGAYMALKQRDMKALLAYSTVSQLGLIVSLLGYGSEAAIAAALFHLMNHSAFKGSLFLVTGMVDHATGTRDIGKLRGLAKAMPFTALLAALGALSMAGLPPFNGFLSKEMFFTSSLEVVNGNLSFLGGFAWVFPVIAVAGSIFTFVYCFIILGKVFYVGPLADDLPKTPHESIGMLIPTSILALFTAIFSIFPNFIAEKILTPAVTAITGHETHLHIALWHGLNWPLLMSAIVIVMGIFVYINIDRVKRFLAKMPGRPSVDRAYDWFIPQGGMMRGAKRITDTHMTGILRDYLVMISLFFVAIIWLVFINKNGLILSFNDLAKPGFFEIALSVIVLIGVLTVVLCHWRVMSIFALGAVGYSVALFFVLFSAPDLALTQLLVETISLVLYFLSLKYLPLGLKDTKTKLPTKIINAIIAGSVGVTVSLICLIGHSNKLFDSIASFYIANSKILAGGNNIVNVILVDFRGLDTMGEISVIGIASIGVFALLKIGTRFPKIELFVPKKMCNNLILNSIVSRVIYIVFALSLYIFFAGHNAPGGGFIAGLMVAAGVVLLDITYGGDFINAKLPIDFKYLIGAGLTFAVSCGLGGLFFGYPFLTHTFGYISLPLLGHMELATATIFDFGVFLVVIGGALTIINSISEYRS